MPLRARVSTATPRVLEDSDVFVGFLCLYLLTASRSPPLGDARPMWEAAESFVRHGGFAINMQWPVNAPLGVGGRYYPVAALLACLVHAPGALLQLALTAWAPARAAQFVVVTSQLGPIMVGAAVPALLFRLLKQMGYSCHQAAWTTLLLGAATPLWVYAHRPYSEVLQVACFLIFFGALWRLCDKPTRVRGVYLGLACAALVNSKNVYFVCLPGAFIHLWWRLRDRPAARRGALLGAAFGLAPGIVALAWYNAVRWGYITSSGYGSVTTGFWGEHILVGLWGQFLSPGKSLFLYAPPLLLSLWGLPRFWRQRRETALAMALVLGPVVLVYARYLFWSGDWGWGPRYLVFALPVLLIPAAEVFGPVRGTQSDARSDGDGDDGRASAGVPDAATGHAAGGGGGIPVRWWRRCAVGAVLSLGVAVQCLGNAFYWDDFINISRQAQQAWLGRADTRGTVLAPYPCFSCFEEVYAVEWLPPMQPIAGHWWLLRHQLAGDDWRTAEHDAPWKRYTSLTLDIKASYEAAAIDWWPFAADPGRRWPVALVTLLLLLAVPWRGWARALGRQ